LAIVAAAGAVVAVVLLAFAAMFLLPPVPVPPTPPSTLTTETMQLYERMVTIYRQLAGDRVTAIKELLLVAVPALSAMAGFLVGRQST
jgi:hypothetical protein